LNEAINDKSYQVLDILAEKNDLSQRQLARQTGLSVGMVNLIVQRLMKTGYLKVANLDRKKMEYILTPKGIAERMGRSYQYFLRAYRTFFESRSRIEALVDPLLKAGHREFFIVGDGEIAQVVELVLRGRAADGVSVVRAQANGTSHGDAVVLDCRLRGDGQPVGISVLEAILNHQKRDTIAV
jgi:predicted transcriptional regulator